MKNMNREIGFMNRGIGFLLVGLLSVFIVTGVASVLADEFSVALNAPADGSNLTTQSVQFNFTVTTDTDLENCSLWTDETSWSSKEVNTTVINNGSVTSISEVFGSDSSFLWNVECNNGTVSNFSASNYTVNIDSTAPTITMGNPQAGVTYAQLLVYLNVSADETINTWMYDLGSGNTTFSPNITITGSEGSNSVTVWANDTFGNWGSASRSFELHVPVSQQYPIVGLIGIVIAAFLIWGVWSAVGSLGRGSFDVKPLVIAGLFAVIGAVFIGVILAL